MKPVEKFTEIFCICLFSRYLDENLREMGREEYLRNEHRVNF